MAQARGFFETLLLLNETTYGTTPSVTPGDSVKLPFNENSLGSDENFIDPNTVTGNRYQVEPVLGNISVQGGISVPLDTRAIGYWFKLLMGAPSTTGAGPYAHEFTPSNTNPSASLEVGFSDINSFHVFSGCKANSMNFNFAMNQELVAGVDILGKDESVDTSTFDSAPSTLVFDRFNAKDLSVKKGGVTVGRIESLSLNISNSLASDIYVVGGNSFRSSLPETNFKVDGEVTFLFEDQTEYNQAINSTETSFQITATSGTDILDIEIQELKFPRRAPTRNGGGPVYLTMPYQAYYQDGAAGVPVTITLTNDVATY